MTLTEAYDILFVSPGAPEKVVRAAYKARATELHPDVGGSTKAFQEIEEALAVIDRAGFPRPEEVTQPPRTVGEQPNTTHTCMACGTRNRVPRGVTEVKCGACGERILWGRRLRSEVISLWGLIEQSMGGRFDFDRVPRRAAVKDSDLHHARRVRNDLAHGVPRSDQDVRRGYGALLAVVLSLGIAPEVDKQRQRRREQPRKPGEEERRKPGEEERRKAEEEQRRKAERARVWREAGFTARQSPSWVQAGFSPEDAAEWRGQGFTARQAFVWKLKGWSSTSAWEWKAAGCTARQASAWAEAGFTPDEAAKWRSEGLGLRSAAEWKAAGVSPPSEWAEQTRREAEERARRKAAVGRRDYVGSPTSFRCPAPGCTEVFSSEKALAGHRDRAHHPSSPYTDPERGIWWCTCGTPNNLDRQVCRGCGRASPEVHVYTTPGDRSAAEDHRCPLCRARCVSPEQLDEHMKAGHTGGEVWWCECGMPNNPSRAWCRACQARR